MWSLKSAELLKTDIIPYVIGAASISYWTLHHQIYNIDVRKTVDQLLNYRQSHFKLCRQISKLYACHDCSSVSM